MFFFEGEGGFCKKVMVTVMVIHDLFFVGELIGIQHIINLDARLRIETKVHFGKRLRICGILGISLVEDL